MSHRDPRIIKLESLLDRLGNLAVESFHYIALFIIGCMVIWSAGHTVFEILTVKKFATIDDILLLFIYLRAGCNGGDILQNQSHARTFSNLYCHYSADTLINC